MFKHLSILVFLITCFNYKVVFADEISVDDVMSKFTNIYSTTLNIDLNTLSKLKVERIEKIWLISELLKLTEHIGLSLTEKEKLILKNLIWEIQDEKIDINAEYTELFNLLSEKTSSYIDMRNLQEISINRQYILSSASKTEKYIFELKNVSDTAIIKSLLYAGESCDKVKNLVFVCEIKKAKFVTDSVEVRPLGIIVQMDYPFYRKVLSKVLGGNESLFTYEYPTFIVQESFGHLKIYGEELEIKEERKTFDFRINYKGNPCRSIKRNWNFNIPEGFKVIGKPVFKGDKNRSSSLKNSLTNGNTISAVANVRNEGKCVSVFGQKISGGIGGVVDGHVSVDAIREFSSMKNVELFSEIVKWDQSIEFAIGDKKISSARITLNNSNELDSSETSLFSIQKVDDMVKIRIVDFNSFVAF